MKLLVTGGTGTFGHAVTRAMLKDAEEIRIFSRDEKKQEDMRNDFNDSRLRFFIGDVRDSNSLVAAMEGVDHVFHAAALKQVPSCEFFPTEAIKTNVLGAENVFNAAINAGVKSVVALSTDKACYPINAMGQSKALMEKIMLAKSRTATKTVFCATRYGNVLGSRGSVVPHFIEQARAGKPLTVTNPDMTRFMMTIGQAIDLVKYAFLCGAQGDIFVQKAPASTVLSIAEAVTDLYNPGGEISIIGTRHGEKLYETLVTEEEYTRAQIGQTYIRIPDDSRDLNYAIYVTSGSREWLARTRRTTPRG